VEAVEEMVEHTIEAVEEMVEHTREAAGEMVEHTIEIVEHVVDDVKHLLHLQPRETMSFRDLQSIQNALWTWAHMIEAIHRQEAGLDPFGEDAVEQDEVESRRESVDILRTKGHHTRCVTSVLKHMRPSAKVLPHEEQQIVISDEVESEEQFENAPSVARARKRRFATQPSRKNRMSRMSRVSAVDGGQPQRLLDMSKERRMIARAARRKRLLERRGICKRLKDSGRLKWYFTMIESYMFWSIFPWVISALLLVIANFFTLLYALRYFAFSIELMTAWLQTVGISLAIGFCFIDIVVIIVRNNINCTKVILTTRRYQVIEKFVVAPLAGLYKMGQKALLTCIEDSCC